MTDTTVTGPAAIAAGAIFLPGRTVELTVHPVGDLGVVVDVTPDGQHCIVKFCAGELRADDFRDVPASHLRAVNPDRPALAFDQFVVGALGEKLAERAGPEALAGFHRGHNDGRIGFTEAARTMLADIDRRSLVLKHQRCHFSHVEAPDGTIRPRGVWEQGDRLVECSFYGDGPAANGWCAVHLPLHAQSSGFHAGTTEAEREASRARGELTSRPPILAPRAEAPAAAVVTEVEQQAIAVDHLVDAMRAVLVDAAQQAAADSEGGADWRGMEPGQLRAGVAEYLDRTTGQSVPLLIWWEAIAHGIRQGRIILHQGPRYSPAPDYAARAAQ